MREVIHRFFDWCASQTSGYRRLVWFVESSWNANGGKQYGSAVAVRLRLDAQTTRYFLLTCAHVVLDQHGQNPLPDSIRVWRPRDGFDSGAGHAAKVASFVGAANPDIDPLSANADWIILELEDYSKIDNSDSIGKRFWGLSLGYGLSATGFPAGIAQMKQNRPRDVVNAARIPRFRIVGRDPVNIHLKGPEKTHPGMSGGPIFSMTGNFVGLHRAVHDSTATYQAVCGKLLKKKLADRNISIESSRPTIKSIFLFSVQLLENFVKHIGLTWSTWSNIRRAIVILLVSIAIGPLVMYTFQIWPFRKHTAGEIIAEMEKLNFNYSDGDLVWGKNNGSQFNETQRNEAIRWSSKLSPIRSLVLREIEQGAQFQPVKLQGLESLTIGSDIVKEDNKSKINQWLKLNPQITKLTIINCDVEQLELPSGLTELIISCNSRHVCPLVELKLSELKSLKSIYIEYCQNLKALTVGNGKHEHLQTVEIFNCGLQLFSSNKTPSLKTLKIENVELSSAENSTYKILEAPRLETVMLNGIRQIKSIHLSGEAYVDKNGEKLVPALKKLEIKNNEKLKMVYVHDFDAHPKPKRFAIVNNERLEMVDLSECDNYDKFSDIQVESKQIYLEQEHLCAVKNKIEANSKVKDREFKGL